MIIYIYICTYLDLPRCQNWCLFSEPFFSQKNVTSWREQKHIFLFFLWLCFSRKRSKGSRFTLGVWGLRVCSLDVAHPFATVCNRFQPFATVRVRAVWPCLKGKFCKRGHFGRFEALRCFLSHGRHGTSWHLDVFRNVWKVVLCGRCNTLATFSEDALQFSWQTQYFGRACRHFAWQAQH